MQIEAEEGGDRGHGGKCTSLVLFTHTKVHRVRTAARAPRTHTHTRVVGGRLHLDGQYLCGLGASG